MSDTEYQATLDMIRTSLVNATEARVELIRSSRASEGLSDSSAAVYLELLMPVVALYATAEIKKFSNLKDALMDLRGGIAISTHSIAEAAVKEVGLSHDNKIAEVQLKILHGILWDDTSSFEDTLDSLDVIKPGIKGEFRKFLEEKGQNTKKVNPWDSVI